MSFKYLNKIPSPAEIINAMPFSAELSAQKKERDLKIKDVFTGTSGKFLMIIGPCSADDEDAVCDYVNRLAKVQEKVEDRIIIIPRIYTNKPRTVGTGYKGMLHQPNPADKPNIVEGIKAIRRMHIRAIAESRMTPADEMLYPSNYTYLEDVLSYVAIGARSVENQQHRLTISGLDIPAGMKNPTGGDIEVMLNSIQAAQSSHVYIHNEWEVETSGNPLTHAVLRGAVDYHGVNTPNYHYEDLVHVADAYKKRGLVNPAIIVDTNHSNSAKKYKDQPRIAKEILNSMHFNPELRKIIKGFMVESYIEEGAQDYTGKEYGKSITDPCLGWDDTFRLIMDVADLL
ncbi:MAG: 3-deoxy-7-phosphoheptulonate synthase [Spirochaetota bacterium]